MDPPSHGVYCLQFTSCKNWRMLEECGRQTVIFRVFRRFTNFKIWFTIIFHRFEVVHMKSGIMQINVKILFGNGRVREVNSTALCFVYFSRKISKSYLQLFAIGSIHFDPMISDEGTLSNLRSPRSDNVTLAERPWDPLSWVWIQPFCTVVVVVVDDHHQSRNEVTIDGSKTFLIYCLPINIILFNPPPLPQPPPQKPTPHHDRYNINALRRSSFLEHVYSMYTRRPYALAKISKRHIWHPQDK